MGTEKVATQPHVDVGSHGFVRPTQTNDHSNPQQGTDGLKPIEQIKQSTAENKSSKPSNSLNDVEDKPKLFVGGLPRTITEPEFRFFFSQFGELHESVVMFDRETGRSRGFGFVTYVDPEISMSILRMGNDGDGIGRLAMRGKICEIKEALPKGEAPSRGSKANRGNRNGTSNQNQPKAYQMTPFVYNEQMAFPHVYSQGGYPAAPFAPGYAAAPMYHPAMHGQYLHQNQGAVLLSADHEFTGGGDIAGAPYFYVHPLANSQIDCFPTPDGFLSTQQNPYNYSQYGYAFIPLVPCPILPVAQTPSIMQPVEQGILMTEDNNDSDGEAIEIKKE